MHTMYGVNPFRLSPEALYALGPAIEKMIPKWRKLDRMELTIAQAESLLEKMEKSRFFHSDYLVNPAVSEILLMISWPGHPSQPAYVAFRPTLLKNTDIIMDQDAPPGMTVEPFVDAYIYIDNGGAFCNFVMTICRYTFREQGKIITSIAEFPIWAHDDPFSDHIRLSDDRAFLEFLRSAMMLYLAVQMLTIDRPESMVRQTVREEHEETVRQKGRYKKIRRTSLVRVIRVPAEELENFTPRVHREYSCPSWGVIGHYRHYKSGKTVWVRPHRKGKERRNPEAYQPKEYTLPDMTAIPGTTVTSMS